MAESGRILIADDEETFLYSTAELLREKGFQCDCASDGIMALEMLRKAEYDLLIADIKMEGNIELELVRGLPQPLESMPVILVTGYPSMGSAIQSIQLSVTAYLIKPFEFDDLLTHVKTAIETFQAVKTVKSLRKQLEQWADDVKKIEEVLDMKSQQGSPAHLDTFVALAHQNISRALANLNNLGQTVTVPGATKEVCHLFQCPHLAEMKKILSETIEVIEKTRKSFKSKELEEWRKKLFGILKEI